MKNIYLTIDEIFVKWQISITPNEIYDLWNAPHRFYHNVPNHLEPMLKKIMEFKNDFDLDQNSFEILIVAALFHDIVYDPKSSSNELDSLRYFDNVIPTQIYEKGCKELIVADLIRMTIDHKPKNKLEELFCMFDLNGFTYDLSNLMKIEDLLFKEFEWVNWKTYKVERIKILKRFLDLRNELPIKMNVQGVTDMINLIENRNPNIAIYAGSFNPFTIAHENIVKKSEQIFDKVILAKGKNDTKKIDEEQFEKEFQNLKNLFPSKEIISYSGLLTDVLREQEGKITLIRGIRNGNDLEAENTLITYMKDMYPELKVVYIPCDKKYEHISSSAIRSIRNHGEHLISKYLP